MHTSVDFKNGCNRDIIQCKYNIASSIYHRVLSVFIRACSLLKKSITTTPVVRGEVNILGALLDLNIHITGDSFPPAQWKGSPRVMTESNMFAGDRVLAHPSDSHIGWAAALINIEFNPVILSFSAYNGAV